VSAKSAADTIETSTTIKTMARKSAAELVRDATVATWLPNMVWAYLTWRHNLGAGTIYGWPWTLLTTVLYAFRADKFALNIRVRGVIAYDLLTIRVAALPFLAAITLPLLNFAFNPKAPGMSLASVLVVSSVSWWLHDLLAVLLRLRRKPKSVAS